MIEKITPDTWNKFWKLKQDEWDYLSEVILDVLKSELGSLDGKYIIEAGSGSGRISQKLNSLSRHVFLLDYSCEALRFSQKFFEDRNGLHKGIAGSIFDLPLKDSALDIIWNAGVIEHYYEDEQHAFLKEAGRALKTGGLYVTLNPYKKSILHTAGKKMVEMTGRYPYGLEMPILSIKKPLDGTALVLKKKEYSIGFILLFVGVFKRLQLLPGGGLFRLPEWLLNKFFIWLYRTPFKRIIVAIDKLMANVLGGYLIVSVAERQAPQQTQDT